MRTTLRDAALGLREQDDTLAGLEQEIDQFCFCLANIGLAIERMASRRLDAVQATIWDRSDAGSR